MSGEPPALRDQRANHVVRKRAATVRKLCPTRAFPSVRLQVIMVYPLEVCVRLQCERD